jgi:hypothetical protein
MLPKPADLGQVDLAFIVFHGTRVRFPGTGLDAYMVEVKQERITGNDEVSPETTGTLLYIYNISPRGLPNLKEIK